MSLDIDDIIIGFLVIVLVIFAGILTMKILTHMTKLTNPEIQIKQCESLGGTAVIRYRNNLGQFYKYIECK